MAEKKMRILIFGASGMLGHVLYHELAKKYDVLGTCRTKKWDDRLIAGVDVSDLGKVETIISDFKPNYILNAVGIIKQLEVAKNKLLSIKMNSLWPHELSNIATKYNAKVIHFSTDCVFSGNKGNYLESDFPDARDTYGLSKLMGEVDYPHALTLRTSIIGHELNSNVSLIDWFLSQSGEVRGFTNAIYSGFPTIHIARFIDKYVFQSWISGVYHLSSPAINKFDLLQIVKELYGKIIDINPDPTVKINRSLDSNKIKKELGYVAPEWAELISEMHDFYCESGLYKRNVT